MKQIQVWRAQLKCSCDYPLGIVNMHLLTIVLLTVWASCVQGQGGTCDFPKIRHGSIYNENRHEQQFPVAIGKNVYYSCEQSFASPKQSVWTRIECTAEGWSPAPLCLRLCVLPSVEHGHSDYSQVIHLEGETVKITCDIGYNLPNNQRSITCTESGWSTEPICIPYFKPCDFPNIPHGALHEESRHRPYFPVPVGKQYYYHCHENFATPSDRTWEYIRCTITGWKPEVPCRRKCLFSYLENGKWIWITKAYYQGESVIPQCNNGFGLPNGEKVMKCTEDGWSPPARCVRIKTCSEIEIQNGFFSETTTEYSLNKEAQYKCKPGYATANGKTSGTIICQEKGWSAQPECIKSCERPRFENALSKRNGTWFMLHDQLEYECKPGYENRAGRSSGSIICQHNGWSEQPVCLEKECTVPMLDEHIFAMPSKQKYKIGEVLKFFCRIKPVRVGPDSVQCYHFGWSPNNTTCRDYAKNCGSPPSLLNGKLTEMERDVYKHNAVLEYVCDPQFLMKGSKKIQCVDGHWTPLPMCIAEKRTCKDKPELENGFAEPSAPLYYHGDSVEFSCTVGFTMIGEKSTTCFRGRWTQLPKCIATNKLKKCKKTRLISSNSSLRSKNFFDHNDNVNYTCDNKSEMKFSTCINGEWDPEISCKDKPIQVCPPPPQIPNSQIMTTTVNYQDGEKISILCQENYLIQESEEMECKNGTWVSVPRCVEKRPCSEPPQIAHGNITSARSSLGPKVYPHGTILNYTCQAGFRIFEEDNKITCSMGQWSSPPQCVGLPCGPPPHISHAVLPFHKGDGYQYGEEFTYSCSEGYGIDGPATAKCLGEKWSSPPECIRTYCSNLPQFPNAMPIGSKKSSYKSGEKVTYKCSYNYQLEGPNFAQCVNSKWIGGPTCRDVSCGRPPMVEHAVTRNDMGSYPPGTRVYYECEKPFKLYGESGEVQCLNGFWTKPPQCKDSVGKCGPPPSIENGDTTSYQVGEYAPESKVDYQCQAHYVLQGDRTIVCRNGQWSEPPRCLTPCVISEDLLNEHNIIFRWAEERKLYSESGDTVDFDCKRGYRRKSYESFRKTCHNGKIIYPTCV
ncbi:complement factor H-like [Sorex fumeus]|uniref:complement factor H-like n=1 Tax=Sorex fumeus TaxID=62283 RepID=UPI0024AE45E2|nr:complement factor H-like [Sorex fumeus]